MSKPAKGSASAPEGQPELPFEEALKKLEAIVEAMESEDLPLENLISNFEQGSRMVQTCQAKLAEAELKIQLLEKNGAGQTVLKPLALADDSEGEA